VKSVPAEETFDPGPSFHPEQEIHEGEKPTVDSAQPQVKEEMNKCGYRITQRASFQLAPHQSDKKTSADDAKVKIVHMAPHMNRMTQCSGRDCEFCQPLFKFTACAGCQSVFYCNATCQRKDWKYHSSQCATLKKASVAASN
jgi:hypothetical protein